MARGITEEDVWTACDALLLAGARPTIERVRQRIGRGSPNTVSPYLDTWFKGLGGRIKDPAAFAAPPELPDPVQQAAKHFWEVALAETRRDFDKRLQDGLAEAVANVGAEKEKAEQANAAAYEAVAKASRLQVELHEQRQALDQHQQDLAADRARVDEVRAALADANEHLRRQSELVAAERADFQRQLSAAIERADAADRRVGLELERERTARTKAERHGEAAQRAVEALRDKSAIAVDEARMLLEAMRGREADLTAKLALAAADLALERQRVAELRASGELSAAEASTARGQVASLQASVDRLVRLMEGKAQRATKAPRKMLIPAAGAGP
ncbi:MAG: DNA-binding protein [Rubrivivax sp.]|nr:DNA-binding protein [Rubrivivax sp.]